MCLRKFRSNFLPRPIHWRKMCRYWNNNFPSLLSSSSSLFSCFSLSCSHRTRSTVYVPISTFFRHDSLSLTNGTHSLAITCDLTGRLIWHQILSKYFQIGSLLSCLCISVSLARTPRKRRTQRICLESRSILFPENPFTHTHAHIHTRVRLVRGRENTDEA